MVAIRSGHDGGRQSQKAGCLGPLSWLDPDLDKSSESPQEDWSAGPLGFLISRCAG